jgi:hypothetical protein
VIQDDNYNISNSKGVEKDNFNYICNNKDNYEVSCEKKTMLLINYYNDGDEIVGFAFFF